MDNWISISYIFVIFFTALITAVITENAVISRIQLSDGVSMIAGKCRLKPNYGLLKDDQTSGPGQGQGQGQGQDQNKDQILYNIQKDIQFIKNKLN